jgi:hypothetical protein
MNKTVTVLLKGAWKFREVLDCGSPLPLCVSKIALEKRRRAGAVQDADALFVEPNPLDGHKMIWTALK